MENPQDLDHFETQSCESISSKDFITWIKLAVLSVFPLVSRIALGVHSIKTEQQPFTLTTESEVQQPGGIWEGRQ